MTLVVSLRVLDGVVLAADSLATLMSHLQIGQPAEVDCPHCASRVLIDDVYAHAKAYPPCPSCAVAIEITTVQRPMLQAASSTLSFAQKVMPFLDTFGIAVFGAAALGSKTLYNHLKGLELVLRAEIASNPNRKIALSGVSGVADDVRRFCETEFAKVYPNVPEDMPNTIFGLQVVGYDRPEDPAAKSIELTFGKQHNLVVYEGLGLTLSGDTRFPALLWQSCANSGLRPTVENLSLQDAVDYADFLVGTTSTVQRFANMIPTVGGEVDVALITNYSEFRWIRSKKLARVLEPKYVSI